MKRIRIYCSSMCLQQVQDEVRVGNQDEISDSRNLRIRFPTKVCVKFLLNLFKKNSNLILQFSPGTFCSMYTKRCTKSQEILKQNFTKPHSTHKSILKQNFTKSHSTQKSIFCLQNTGKEIYRNFRNALYFPWC